MQISPESCVKLAIVDDHTLFRQGLSYILRRMITCEVVIEVASGPELFAALPTVLPDVVLLDLHMQEMDGKEVSRRLLEQYPQIKIIILSMDYSPDFILELMRLGVHGYLPKDIDQRILKEAIEQVQTKGYYIDDTVAQVMQEGLRNKKKSVSLTNGLLLTLTEREKEVLELLCQGLSSVQIAEKLFISLRTVEGHRKNLLEKTGASNAVSLAMFAMKHRMIEGF
jgi:two-component system response regulator DegU